MVLRDILQRREAIKAELRTLHAGAAEGALGDEAQARWTALEAELGTLDAQERRAVLLNDLDARGGTPVDADRRFDALHSEFRISDVFAAQLGATSRAAGAAREASAEIARQRGRDPNGLYVSMRSLSRGAELRADPLTSGAQGTLPNGATLIPTVTRGDLLIETLRAQTVLAGLGVTFLTGLVGNVTIPRFTQGTSVGWFAENAPIPKTGAAFDAVSMSVKHVGAITEYSRNMLLNSNPDVDALLRSDLMRALAVELDRAAIAGVGDGITPRGIIATPGVTKVPFGGSLSWQNVLTLASTPSNFNIPMTSLGFIGTPRFRAKAMQTLSSPGVASQFVMTSLTELAGNPFAATTLIPDAPATTGANAKPATSTLIFGAFSQLLVAVWDALDLTANPWADSVYNKANVQLRIIADVDVAVRHPEAFAYADDVGV